jgi:hypothetical protein
MSKLARWIAPAALAGGLVSGLFAVPAAQASSAAATITIKATSPNFPGLTHKDHGLVDGHALVIYKIAGRDTATISGNVTETTGATDTAALMAKPFGKTSYTAVGSPVSLTPGTNGVAPYSFLVTPSLATNYKVVVSGTDSVTSSPVTVYVTLGNVPTSNKVSCTRARCVDTVKVSTTVPASALKTEMRKHIYLYLAIGHLRGTKPILPKDYTLSTASSASRPTRKTPSRFVVTLKFIVPHPNARTVWAANACAKDAVSKDGIGLPGHHACGNTRVPRNILYLG